MLTGTDLLITKFLYIFSDNFIVVFNLRFLVIFPLSSMIAYGVLRCLSLNFVLSAFGGLVYSFSPYIFYRNVGHLSLATCYFVPLSVLLCVWAIYSEDSDYLKFDKNSFGEAKHGLHFYFAH